MESNVMTTYKDTTPAPRVEKKILNKMVWRSMQLQACFNYERMQSAGWLWAMLPGLQAVHKNKDDLAASMTHNMDFLNTHPFAVTFVMGIVLSMEQMKTDIQTIRSVRISVAAPLGGIGDALFWYTLIPITAGLTANMAIDGSSYNLGMKAVQMMTANAKAFTHAASVLGVFVVGALISNYGSGTKLGISIPNGQTVGEDGETMVDVFINIQDYLNMILPCLIPLLFTLMCYFLISKKGWTPVKCIGLFLVIGIVGGIFGIWAGTYTPLVPVPWQVVA